MTIYFICPDLNAPSGGIKQIYRQVDVLNKHNIRATVMHKTRGFRCDWFKNTTQIVYREELEFTDKDIVVLPEAHGPLMGRLFPKTKKVIFNQGCFQTFAKYPLYTPAKETPYTHPEVIGTIVTSDASEEYMRFVFPQAKVVRITIGIDKETFYPAKKKKQICFMPRKLIEDARQIVNILRLHNTDIPLIPIENMSQEETAKIMRESLLFLSFNYHEGFGMPPLEAMASGCYVIGYAGQGGDEYFNEYTTKIPDGEIIDFVKAIQTALKDPALEDKGKKASEWAHEHYSLEKEEKSIVDAWNRLLKEYMNSYKV